MKLRILLTLPFMFSSLITNAKSLGQRNHPASLFVVSASSFEDSNDDNEVANNEDDEASETSTKEQKIIQRLYPKYNEDTKAIDHSGKAIVSFQYKPLPNDQTQVAALIGFKNGGEFALLKEDHFHKFSIIGRYPIIDMNEDSSLTFDFARYKLNSKERAFGFRVSNTSSGTRKNEIIKQTTLILFKIDADSLNKIFSTVVDSSDTFTTQVSSTHKLQTQTTISVQKSSTLNNFDWTTEANVSEEETDGNMVISKNEWTETATYKWNGKTYLKTQWHSSKNDNLPSSPTQDSSNNKPFQNLVHSLYTTPTSHDSENGKSGKWNTWIPETGIRGMLSKIELFMSLRQLIQLFPGIILTNDRSLLNTPNFYSKSDFAHYNPQFVKWLTNNIESEILNAPKMQYEAQALYNKQFKALARVYYVTYVDIIQNNGNSLNINTQSEIERYQLSINSSHVKAYNVQNKFYKYAESMNQKTKLQNDLNVYNGFVAPGFWFRRSIDGTQSLWFNLLKKIMLKYDKDFVLSYAG